MSAQFLMDHFISITTLVVCFATLLVQLWPDSYIDNVRIEPKGDYVAISFVVQAMAKSVRIRSISIPGYQIALHPGIDGWQSMNVLHLVNVTSDLDFGDSIRLDSRIKPGGTSEVFTIIVKSSSAMLKSEIRVRMYSMVFSITKSLK